MLCDHCKHADAVGGYPDGQDMFMCGKENDPRVPFTVDEKTAYCACYEPDPEIDGVQCPVCRTYNPWNPKLIMIMCKNCKAVFY